MDYGKEFSTKSTRPVVAEPNWLSQRSKLNYALLIYLVFTLGKFCYQLLTPSTGQMMFCDKSGVQHQILRTEVKMFPLFGGFLRENIEDEITGKGLL